MSHSIRLFAFGALALATAWTTPALAQAVSAANSAVVAGGSSTSNWTIRPRGRFQLDYGSVSAPRLDLAANQVELGPDTRVRRAYLGVDIATPDGWGARFEADFAAKPLTLVDAYLFYKPRKDITITVGQHKPFWGLEELGSDNFTTFQERAAFTTAFGFERRIGLSGAYAGKDVLLQAGVFADDATSFGFPDSGTAVPRDFDDAWSIDGRAVYMPKIGKGQIHLGGSLHYRRTKNVETLRYRARPFLRTTDLRFVDTRNIAGADGEFGIGLETAYIQGPFHASAETFWQKVLRPGQFNPTFNGGYAELGYVVTGGTTTYRGGVYDRLSPRKPVSKGGTGAVQVNARYDWLDLSDGPVVGGRQDVAGLSLVWVPETHLRLLADYGHFWIHNSPVTASGGQHDYEADSFGLRAQFDF